MGSIMLGPRDPIGGSGTPEARQGTGRRILITGAGGYLGRLLAGSLARSGARLLLVDRAFPGRYAPPAGIHTVREADAAAPASLEHVARMLDRPLTHVVHAAAVTARPEQVGVTTLEYLDEHIRAAVSALHLARAHGARLLVVSSAAVFSARRGGMIDESSVPDGTGPYAVAKRIIELATVEACDGRFDAGVVRLGNLFGGDERPGVSRPTTSWVQQAIDAARQGRTITVEQPDAIQDWTYAPDVADAMATLLDTPFPDDKILHLSSGEALSRWDAAGIIAGLIPEARIDRAETTTAPIRGVLVSTRYRPPSGWTPFRDGVAETVRRSRRTIAD